MNCLIIGATATIINKHCTTIDTINDTTAPSIPIDGIR